MNTEQWMLALIRSVLVCEPIDETLREQLTVQSLQPLYALSKRHDMAHLVAAALERERIPVESTLLEKFRKQHVLALYRYENITCELTRSCDALERAGIVHLPLKGAVLRQWYPEGWMRTSCDIDVLVQSEELERAAVLLEQELGYTRGAKNSHDITLVSPNGVHFELHYDLVEGGVLSEADVLLRGVWETALPVEGLHYRRKMTDEMFCLYHVAHMAKHFVHGGCGVRPLLDLWVMERCGVLQSCSETLLARVGMLRFSEQMRRLVACWFDGEPMDEAAVAVEKYLLFGGVYGNVSNQVLVQQQKRGGKWSYFRSRVFLTYDSMKYLYPVVEQHRWLMPFLQVRRWCRVICRGRGAHAVRELSLNRGVTEQQSREVAALLEQVGLSGS